MEPDLKLIEGGCDECNCLEEGENFQVWCLCNCHTSSPASEALFINGAKAMVGKPKFEVVK